MTRRFVSLADDLAGKTPDEQNVIVNQWCRDAEDDVRTGWNEWRSKNALGPESPHSTKSEDRP